MLKQKITYYDLFTDEQVSEEFYFNLTQTEIMELEIDKMGLNEYITKIAREEDVQKVWGFLKELVLKAYGERDGSRFVKNDKLREEFVQHPAFDALMMSFFEGDDGKAGAENAAKFVEGIIPKHAIK